MDRSFQVKGVRTMTYIKTLILAMAAAASLGIGAAMADGESAGGADVYSRPVYASHHYVVTTTERHWVPAYSQ
jgi:hypothetical protein